MSARTKYKVKKGDTVIVTTGGNKGKTGEVLKVLVEEARVLVRGVNVRQKHKKATQTSPGGVEKIELPIHISNVAVVDPKLGKATRVGYKVVKDKKVRVAKKSGETLDK